MKRVDLRSKLNKMSGLELVDYLWIFTVFIYLFIELNYLINYPKLMPINWVADAMPVIMTGLFGVKIFLIDEHSIKEKLVIGGIILIVLASACLTQRDEILVLTMAALSAKNISYSKYINKIFFFAFTLTLVESMMMLLVGITTDEVVERGTSVQGIVVRHSLGYHHFNALGFVCMGVVITTLLLLYNKRKMWHYLALLAFTGAFYYVSSSRASAGTAVIAILGCLIARKFSVNFDKSKILPFIAGACVLLVSLGMVLISILYDPNNGMFQVADKVLSTRLSLSHKALNEYGVSILGQSVEFAYPVDCMYIKAIILDGLLPLIVWVAGMVYATIRTAKNGRWELCAICCAVAIYSTMESGMLSICNMAALAVAAELSGAESTKSSIVQQNQ